VEWIFDFGVDFVTGNSKKIAKIGFGKEKSVRLSMCSHCQI
jgi:hypothetical protein